MNKIKNHQILLSITIDYKLIVTSSEGTEIVVSGTDGAPEHDPTFQFIVVKD